MMDIRPNKHDYYLQIRIKHGFTYTENITMIGLLKNWSRGGYEADKMSSTKI